MSHCSRWLPTGPLVACRWLGVAACVVVLAGTSPVSGQARSAGLDTSIQPAGTVSFKLHTKQAWRNGAGQERAKVTFLRIPDLAEVSLQQTEQTVGLSWRWLGVKGAPNFQPLVSELPGPETYFVQFTWDAERGRCDFYVNGIAMRDPRLPFQPWEFEATPSEMLIPAGPFTISDLKAVSGFLSSNAARAEVPRELLGRRADAFGREVKPPAMAIEDRRGRVLVELGLGTPEDVKDWVMEGPGKVTFDDGWIEMRSTRPDAGRGENGHIVFWCPRDFPESFVAEWDVQILEDAGLTIFFFAAKGENGEDVFDPALPKRDGTFTHYIRGAVNSYHISYYASTPGYPGRATANLRKNNQFYLAASGPVAIPGNDKELHRVRLVKDGPRIQFQTDGKVVIDFTDPGTDRYGPVYGAGKMAFRQMQWTVARYRNFRVTELLPAPKVK